MASVFRQAVQVFIDRELSPAAQSARLVQAARAGRDSLIASGRASPRYTTFVDGAEAATEDGAHRTIIYQYFYLADAVGFALGFLRARSPVESGRFMASFVVAVNGVPIKPADQIPPGAEVLIYNSQPYSRKVDVQLTGRRRLKFTVPPNMFQDAARAVQSRFGNTVTCRRVIDIRFAGQWVGKMGRRGKPTKNTGRLTSNPALLITGLR